MKKTILWIMVIGIGLGLALWSAGFWLGGCASTVQVETPIVTTTTTSTITTTTPASTTTTIFIVNTGIRGTISWSWGSIPASDQWGTIFTAAFTNFNNDPATSEFHAVATGEVSHLYTLTGLSSGTFKVIGILWVGRQMSIFSDPLIGDLVGEYLDGLIPSDLGVGGTGTPTPISFSGGLLTGKDFPLNDIWTTASTTTTTTTTQPPVHGLTPAWTKQIGTSSYDSASGLAADSNGNIYVAGTTLGTMGTANLGQDDIVLVKYTSGGVQQWVKQFGTAFSDSATSVAVNAGGDVFLVANDLLARLDSSGSIEMSVSLGGFNCIAADNSGNGYLVSRTNLDKYNATGTVVFDQFISNTNLVADKLDSNNNIIVAGYATLALFGQPYAGDEDVIVSKYDSAGARLWTREFGGVNLDESKAIATDTSNNIYVTGNTNNLLSGWPNSMNGMTDCFLAKYSSDGTQQWIRQFGASSLAVNQAAGVAVDPSGNIFVTGYTNGSLDGNTQLGNNDAFLVKYGPGGNKLWAVQFGTPANDQAAGVAADLNGNIYIAGSTTGGLNGNASLGSSDIFLVKYSSAEVNQ